MSLAPKAKSVTKILLSRPVRVMLPDLGISRSPSDVVTVSEVVVTSVELGNEVIVPRHCRVVYWDVRGVVMAENIER